MGVGCGLDFVILKQTQVIGVMQKASTRWPPSTHRSLVRLGARVSLPLDVRYTVSAKLAEKTGIVSISGVLLYVDQKGNGSSVLHVSDIQHNGSERGIAAKAHFENKLFKSLSTARSAVLGLQTRPSGWGFFSTETAETERGRAVSKPLNLWKGADGITLCNCLDRNPYYSGDYPIATALIWDDEHGYSSEENKKTNGTQRATVGMKRKKAHIDPDASSVEVPYREAKVHRRSEIKVLDDLEPNQEEKAVVIDFFQSLHDNVGDDSKLYATSQSGNAQRQGDRGNADRKQAIEVEPRLDTDSVSSNCSGSTVITSSSSSMSPSDDDEGFLGTTASGSGQPVRG